MNKLIVCSSSCVTIACALLCAACGSSQSSGVANGGGSDSHAGTADILCYTSPDTQKVWVSSVFTVNTSPPERMLEEPWAQDFRRFLGQSGNEGGINVTCDQVTSTDAQKAKADALRKQGHEVVELKWSYAGG